MIDFKQKRELYDI